MTDEGMRRRTGSLQCERGGVWTMRVSVKGRVYSRTAGTRDRVRAEMELAKFVVAAEREHAPASVTAPLLEEWPRYEDSTEAARLSPKMRGSRYRAWRCFSTWMKSEHPDVGDARAVTRRMAEEYMSFFGRGRSAMTYNLCVCSLRAVFRVLLGRDAEGSNPLDFVAPKPSDSHPRRELSADEVRRVVATAADEGGEWPQLVALGVYTGMRLGDCCRLSWDSVNLAQGVIRLVPHKTRRYARGRCVTIPIHEQLMAVLAATPPPNRTGFVLPCIADKYETARWRISKGLDRIFDGAGIVKSVMYEGRSRRTPSATFHSLRHSFVSFAANAGVPLVVVQAMVGHASAAMTRHYYHADESALRRAVNAIPAFGSDGMAVVKEKTSSDAIRGLYRGGHQPPISLRLARAKRLFMSGQISEGEYAGIRERILAEV